MQTQSIPKTSMRVLWRSVFIEHANGRTVCIMDGKRTERAAHSLALDCSKTYPDAKVSVFHGKRIGRFEGSYANGQAIP